LILLGKPEEALVAAKTAKKLDPEWTKAYVREAQAYVEMKEFGEAAASYFEALKLEPTNKDLRALFEQTMEAGKRHYQETQQKK